ncbi:MAG: HupE/UreJ family protein [Azospirillaceae bacterium]
MTRIRPTALAAAGLAGALALAAGAAEAHTGHGPTAGFAHGVTHPILGADHVLAMVAVGLWAALAGGRSLWAVPAAFVGAMLVGGAVGMAGIGLPGVELLIVGSVVVLGALIAFGVRLPVAAGMAVVAAFAVFHGQAHGAEMPAGAGAIAYAAGFALATAALHGVGIAIASIAGKLAEPRVARAGGAAIALGGVGLFLLG